LQFKVVEPVPVVVPKAQYLNEGDLDRLVSLDQDPEQEISEAIVEAFGAAQIDVFAKPTVLYDWIDPDLVEELVETAPPP
jgi:hypothetical protein